jgi:putative oxidoreductase
MLHGTQKLFGFPDPSRGGQPDFTSLTGIAGVLEVFGGALLLVGFLTRPVAFVLSGEMAVAYFRVHLPQGFWPTMNNGELAALYAFVWLYFAAAGAGPWSVDARIAVRRADARNGESRDSLTSPPWSEHPTATRSRTTKAFRHPRS